MARIGISRPAYTRLSQAAGITISGGERITRPLKVQGRWPDTTATEISPRALASWINGSAAWPNPTDAGEAAFMLGGCEFVGAQPLTADQSPRLGGGNWDDVLARTIENTARREVLSLPNEIWLNAKCPSVMLTWCDGNGFSQRIETYENSDCLKQDGILLKTMTIVFGDLIRIAGEVLRATPSRKSAPTRT